MNNFTGGHSADIINVVDEFDYSTQHSSYNTEFIKWRKQRNNPFTFNFRANQREIVYIEGRGFVARYPLEEENDVLSKIFYTLGLAALIWLVMDTIAVKLVAQVLSIFGFSCPIRGITTYTYHHFQFLTLRRQRRDRFSPHRFVLT